MRLGRYTKLEARDEALRHTGNEGQPHAGSKINITGMDSVLGNNTHSEDPPLLFDLELDGLGVTLHFLVNEILMCFFFGIEVRCAC